MKTLLVCICVCALCACSPSKTEEPQGASAGTSPAATTQPPSQDAGSTQSPAAGGADTSTATAQTPQIQEHKTAPPDEPNEPLPEAWWEQPDKHCPPGTKFDGGAPPEKHTARCVNIERNWTEGPSTYFYKDGGKKRIEGRNAIVSLGGDRAEVRLVGLWHRWNKAGQLLEEKRLDKQGRPHGTWRQFSAAGKPLGTSIFVEGNGIWRTWYDSGQLKSEGAMKNGERFGAWTSYHEDGKQRRVEQYDDAGKSHGPFVVYTETGKEKLTGAHEHGDEVGDWTYRDDEGVIQRVVTHHPKLSERTVVYYQDGKPLGSPAPKCTLPGDASPDLREALFPTIDRRPQCVERADAFPGYFVIGGFAHDRGCMTTHVVLDCVVQEKVPAQALLERAGWKEAKAEARTQIAERYLRQVATVFRGSISNDKGVDIKATDDGGVTASFWVQRPSGMLPQAEFDQYLYTFSPAGTVSVEKKGSKVEKYR